MITVKQLIEILETLPPDATLVAYEGEGCGLIINYREHYGWIETGWTTEKEADPAEHDVAHLQRFYIEEN